MDIQKIAQQLLNDLHKEAKEKAESHILIQGAMQGVELLFSKIKEEGEKENAEAKKVKKK